jgi:hypothetical protein
MNLWRNEFYHKFEHPASGGVAELLKASKKPLNASISD